MLKSSFTSSSDDFIVLLAANILAITFGIIDLNQHSRRVSERNISQSLCSGHQGAEPRYTAVNHDFHPFFLSNQTTDSTIKFG